MASSSDPEVRELSIATARAYAIAERLASELENTVSQLIEFVDKTPKKQGVSKSVKR